MPDFTSPDVRSLIGKAMKASPSDVRLVAQRLRDHALEPRLSAGETRALVRELGYDSLSAFCDALGLPAHIAERWDRFGVSGEMKQVFGLLAAHRARLATAIEEFEAATHVGIDDFLRERNLL